MYQYESVSAIEGILYLIGLLIVLPFITIYLGITTIVSGLIVIGDILTDSTFNRE